MRSWRLAYYCDARRVDPGLPGAGQPPCLTHSDRVDYRDAPRIAYCAVRRGQEVDRKCTHGFSPGPNFGSQTCLPRPAALALSLLARLRVTQVKSIFHCKQLGVLGQLGRAVLLPITKGRLQ